MKLEFNEYGTCLTVTREPQDPTYKNGGYAEGNAGESRLLYHIKKKLNNAGCDFVKVRMWKDGHLVDDMQQYIRARNKSTDSPHIYIHNSYWAIEGAEVGFNKNGKTWLRVTMDVFGVQPDCLERLAKINEVLANEN